jgi:polyhydroxyalkanoate synthesis regulator phasin
MLKEILLAGVGIGIILKDKVEDELKKLQDDGKIKSSDTQSFLTSLQEKCEIEDERIKKKLHSRLKEMIHELGIATKDDIEKLKLEIEKLKEELKS